MPYTSDELTHFVGRMLPSDDHRLELLCHVIQEGLLIDPSHFGRRDRIFMAGLKDNLTGAVVNPIEYSSMPNVRHDLASRLSQNQLVQFETVCFCDIPLADIATHCQKYSYFGLAFSKTFLIRQGASPVMYVPVTGTFAMQLREHNGTSGELQYHECKNGNRGALFDELMQRQYDLGLLRYRQLQHQMLNMPAHAPQEEVRANTDETVRALRTMLFYQTGIEAAVFGHLKFFDPSLPADHPDNYYMEREWRISGHLHFGISDIQRVLVPAAYASKLIAEIPELGACITPIEAG
jgi:hypothetical protein